MNRLPPFIAQAVAQRTRWLAPVERFNLRCVRQAFACLHLLNDVSAAHLPTVWNAAAIRHRTAALFKDAMVIWPYPAA